MRSVLADPERLGMVGRKGFVEEAHWRFLTGWKNRVNAVPSRASEPLVRALNDEQLPLWSVTERKPLETTPAILLTRCILQAERRVSDPGGALLPGRGPSPGAAGGGRGRRREAVGHGRRRRPPAQAVRPPRARHRSVQGELPAQAAPHQGLQHDR